MLNQTWLGRSLALPISLASALLVSFWFFHLGSTTASAEESDPSFLAVKGIFERRCLECHNATDRQGGLSMETESQFREGGESGDIVGKEDFKSGLLMESIRMIDGKAAMPKDRPSLKQEEVDAIEAWLAKQAPWPNAVKLSKPKGDLNWWSLQPIQPPAMPDLNEQQASWIENPVDAFVAEMHGVHGLRPAPRADRRTLIRRLYADLIGLPPSPSEIAAFLSDPSPTAYTQLVDRLLASPAYGERWARHWLDVVHYGETHGYDKDKPRMNAWPYRDYCIRAFNRDIPFNEFILQQIAGDVLEPDSGEALEALGFLSAGPWDFIGHAEVPESKKDGKIARHIDRDDFVQNTMLTFQSTTVGCAQCHDHKFDPVSQEEYYRLQAVFSAIDRTEIEYYSNPKLQRRWTELKRVRDANQVELKAVEDSIALQGGSELVAANQQVNEARAQATAVPQEYGYHSAIESNPNVEKWVQVDLGKSEKIDELQWVACHDDFAGIGDGFGFPVRFRIEVSDDAEFKVRKVVVDCSKEDGTNPKCELQKRKLEGTSGRFVRFTATKLALRQNDYIFAISELRVMDEKQKNLAENKPVQSLDSIEAPPRWRSANLVDGLFPKAAISAETLQERIAKRDAILQNKVDSKVLKDREQIVAKRDAIEKQIAALPTRQKTFVGNIHFGSGAFVGTGMQAGKPRPIQLLARGDVTRPVREVQAGSLQCFPQLQKHFEGSDSFSDGERRSALAHWIADEANPLTWRSMANRLWHYHFGTGLVDTPNDFGRMGGLPSHPKLLDYLALELRGPSQENQSPNDVRNGQSIKHLQRLIVTSATYQQQSQGETEFEELDPANRYLWKMNRRRLDAESIRDAMLSISGQLHRDMGGPSFQDFVIEHPEHSPHYEYRLHDPSDPTTWRRSIYRMIVRSQTQPFLTCLDCADPSMQVDKRNESNSALQALALLNDRLSLYAAEVFASRLEKESSDLQTQVQKAFEYAIGRPIQLEELQALLEHVKTHGLASVCRVLFNLNEFIYVD